MKAWIYRGPYSMEMVDLPKPIVAFGEVLVRVEANCACGSDVHGFAGKTGRRKAGMVMGHELAGIVEEVYSPSASSLVGKRVVVQPIISCGTCELCQAGLTSVCLAKRMIGVNMGTVGGLGEYVCVPQANVFPIGQGIAPAAAALTEPFAVGEGAASAADALIPGAQVCIVGSGTIGLTTLLMVLNRKPSRVFMVDQNQRKLDIAKGFGATALNYLQEDPVQRIFAETSGLGVDVVFEAVGISASVKTAMSVLRTGGTAVWIGNSERTIELDMQDVVVGMKRIVGTYAYNNVHFRTAVEYVSTHSAIASLFAEESVPFSEAQSLFNQLAKGEKDLLRGVILFD